MRDLVRGFLFGLAVMTIAAGWASAGEMISIPATSAAPAVPAYVARPATTTPAPAVLVLPGCDGYSARYASIANGLARHGYVAIALAADETRNSCADRNGSRMEAQDARAALVWLCTQASVDGARLALLGYSMGAIAALDLVDSRRVRASPARLVPVVAYYPNCHNRRAARLTVPLRILDGDADDWTPAAPCIAFAQTATAARKAVEITTYPGATHAFDVDARDRVVRGHHLRYDAAAASDAATQTLMFFAKYLMHGRDQRDST